MTGRERIILASATKRLNTKDHNWDELLLTDPWGRVIRIAREQWDGHVLDEHDEMEGLLDEVIATIEEPGFTSIPAGYPERRNYYAQLRGRLKILAVVSFSGRGPGYLVTAYIVRHLRKNEVLEWQKS